MKRILLILGILAAALPVRAVISLDYCRQKARENYPLIRKYGLIEKTGELDLAEINRGWLPRVTVSAQATVQNAVPSFPDVLKGMMAQTGYDMRGLDRFQYKASVEVGQTIWDGGASKARRMVSRAATEEARGALSVDMYAVDEQVDNLYFGILLLEEQMARTESSIDLLKANHTRLESMVRNGAAMQADADMVEAQWLTLRQRLSEARSAAEGYRILLGLYVGEEIGTQPLELPRDTMPDNRETGRPELTLFDRRLNLNRLRQESLKASVMPRISFFAQAYYGYPGLNYFESMKSRTPSFNILAGLSVSWSIDALYTNGLSRRRLDAEALMLETGRDTFLFGNRLETERELASIKGLKEVMADDTRIVLLRENVRRNAESRLKNGVIETTALLSAIDEETRSRLDAVCHEIQLIEYIYQLRHTLNK